MQETIHLKYADLVDVDNCMCHALSLTLDISISLDRLL